MSDNQNITLIKTAIHRIEAGEQDRLRAALMVAMLFEYNLWTDHTSGVSAFREVVTWWRDTYPQSTGLSSVQLLLTERRKHLWKQGNLSLAKALTDWHVQTDQEGKDGFERLDYLLKLRTAKVEAPEGTEDPELFKVMHAALRVYLYSPKTPVEIEDDLVGCEEELRSAWTSLAISGRFPTAYTTYFRPDRPGVLMTSMAKDMDDFFGTNQITPFGYVGFVKAAEAQTLGLVLMSKAGGAFGDAEDTDLNTEARVNGMVNQLCDVYQVARASTPVPDAE